MQSPFFPLPVGFTITALEQGDDTLSVQVRSLTLKAICPLCGQASERIHSRYTRILADLPLCGQKVRLVVEVRRFFCNQVTCVRKVFVERLADLTQPWARMTNRLVATLQTVGLATCGEGGARLAAKLGMPISPTTLLRRLMALPTPIAGPVEVLGIDDFSFRRGRTFGTIFVNLETHRVIDLLPDREAATVAAWLHGHPEIRIVSRDRGTDYARVQIEGEGCRIRKKYLPFFASFWQQRRSPGSSS